MARIRPSDVADARTAQIDAETRRVRPPTYPLLGVDVRDETAPTKTPRRGAGQKCGYCGIAEGTRWLGEWRCDTCPPPSPIEVAAELDPTERDPRKRWPRRAWRTVANTGRHEDLMEESA